MRRLLQVSIAAAALAVLGWSAGSAAQDAERGQTAAAQRAAGGVTIKSARSQFGKVLFSKGGRAIYYFDKEQTSKPQCYGACARAWPPVLTKGRPQAAGRVKQRLLGTRKRSNGKKQVTYDGHPLYFYVDDPRGKVLCHDIEEFGGLWLAVRPGGAAVGS